jgi:hypothetical protein
MATAYANPRQKTHETTFEVRVIRYPWHRWFGRGIQTRSAGGVHYNTAYLCKLPEAPPWTMLVEVPKWMFDAGECGSMRIEDTPVVDCTILRELIKVINEQRSSLEPAVIQPQLCRKPGDGGADERKANDSHANNTDSIVRRTSRRATLERSDREDAGRNNQPAGTASRRSSKIEPTLDGTRRAR